MKENFQENLTQKIRCLYFTETHLIDILTLAIKVASNQELIDVFQYHLLLTKRHQQRLLEIAKILAMPLTNNLEACGKDSSIWEIKDSNILNVNDSKKDARLIASCQRVVLYLLEEYNYAQRLAKILGKNEISKVIAKSLREDSKASKELDDLTIKFI